MRTHSAQDDAVFLGPGQTSFVRAFVKDAGGNFRDLTNLGAGWNFLDAVEVRESVDEVAASCTLTLRREIFKLSLATDVAGSPLNTLGGGTKLLALNAEVYVEAQIQPLGAKAPVSNAWKEIFRGRIEKTNPGQDPFTVECRDFMSRLQTRWIKSERAYGVWQASRRAPTGYVVVPSTDNPGSPSAYWQWTSATGTTGGTEPTWPGSPTPGVTTVADNGGTWTCIAAASGGTPMETLLQLLADDNTTVGTYALYTPSSPSFLMRDYNQRKEPLQSAMQTVANCVAWDLRYRWDDGASAFRLTLLNPNRSNVTSQYTLPASKYQEIKDYPSDLAGVRNFVEVAFLDGANLDASGNPQPNLVQVQDAASITSYDEQFFGVAEGASSPITTLAQATAMANAILSDLAQPLVALPITMELTWWLQLHDMVTLKKDGIHADSDQVMAVATIAHRWAADGTAQTELGLRAKPCSGHWSWHRNASGAPGLNGGAAKVLGPRTPSTVTITPGIRGGAITWRIPQTPKERYDITEVYVSTSNGFTPSSANRVYSGRGARVDLTSLTPGTTYYVKVRHLDVRGNPGAYTAQQSFVAGKVGTADVDTTLNQSFKYKAIKSGTITTDGTLNPWGSRVIDGQTRFSSGTFTPIVNTLGRLHAVLLIRGTAITPGCRAYIYLLEAGTVVAIGKWCFASVAGDTLNQPEIIAEFDQMYPCVASTAYTFACKVIDADGNTITPGTSAAFIDCERLAQPAAWLASPHVYAVGDIVRKGTSNGRAYRCLVGGTAQASEPTFPTTDYGTVTETGGVKWEENGSDTGKRVGSYVEFTPCAF